MNIKLVDEKKNTDMENNCPLSSTDWVMVLNDEINKLENVIHHDYNIFMPTFTLFIAVASIIISSMFGTISNPNLPQNSVADILSGIKSTFIILSFLFLIVALIWIYRLLVHLWNKKVINTLKIIRKKIICGELTDSNEIRKEWEKVIKIAGLWNYFLSKIKKYYGV